MKRQKLQTRFSIAIVGEGPTEWAYFDHIRVSRRYSFVLKPELPKHSDYKTVFKKGKELASKGYDLVFCVVDMDTIIKYRILNEFNKVCKSLPKKVVPITSMPCIEFWFYLHMLEKPLFRLYNSYDDFYSTLIKKIPDYEKTRKYFEQSKIFSRIEANSGLNKAINNSNQILQKNIDECSYSEVSLVLEQLEACRVCKKKSKCLTCYKKLISSKKNK
ncbi:MAG: RloB family protein [Sphaerochaetaceae bacterium]|nr:RloB family protein [Sphaerochaetaceae bacterium]